MTDQELFEKINAFKKIAVTESLWFAAEREEGMLYALIDPAHHMRVFGKTEAARRHTGMSRCGEEERLWSDAPLMQDCVEMRMCDRGELDRDDYRLIKSLGLSYRGRGQWPRLRRLRPARVPWFLNEDDRRTLGDALDAARRLSELDRLNAIDGACAVISLKTGEVWLEKNRLTEPLPPSYAVLDITDEMLLARLKRLPKSQAVWEATVQAFPFPVGPADGGAPFCTQMLLMVDEGSDTVLNMALSESPEPEDYTDLAGAFIEQLRSSGCPALLRLANARAQALLEPLCAAIGLRTELTPDLPQLEEAFSSLLRYAAGEEE